MQGEVEKFQLGEGCCFGENDILSNGIYTCSTYALEDTSLFYMEKEAFNLFFAKAINKSLNEKKAFLRSVVNTFNEYSKFDELYSKFIEEIYGINKTLYTENSKGTCFYIVYKGLFILQKNYNKKKRTIVKLNSGAFAGLEVLYSKNQTYAYTLKTSIEDFNMIFKIDFTLLGEYKNKLYEELKTLYEQQSQFLARSAEEIRLCEAKTTVSYRNLISERSSQLDEKIQGEVMTTVKTSQCKIINTARNIHKSTHSCINFDYIKDRQKYQKSFICQIAYSDKENENTGKYPGRNKRTSLSGKSRSLRENEMLKSSSRCKSINIKSIKRLPLEMLKDEDVKSEGLYLTQDLLSSPGKKENARLFHKNSMVWTELKESAKSPQNVKKKMNMSKELKACINLFKPYSHRSTRSQENDKANDNRTYRTGIWCIPLISQLIEKKESK